MVFGYVVTAVASNPYLGKVNMKGHFTKEWQKQTDLLISKEYLTEHELWCTYRNQTFRLFLGTYRRSGLSKSQGMIHSKAN